MVRIVEETFDDGKYTRSNAWTDICALATWGLIERTGRGTQETLRLTDAGRENGREVLLIPDGAAP